MSKTSSSPRPYSPTGNDHLIFRWVKLEGQSQAWVASQFGISQSTVSRIIQRYERWQAHAAEREGGRLDHAERLRYQRWLTFQRNELILASCLRIAQNLEGFVDASKSTTTHPRRYPQQETQVRTENFAIDRTGTVARFLRLAYRINMDQLKLAQLDPAPLPEPLSAEELAAQEHDALAIAEEFTAAKRRSTEQLTSVREAQRNTPFDDVDPDLVTRVPPGDALTRGSSLVEPSTDTAFPTDPSPPLNVEPGTVKSSASSTENLELETSNSLHNLHNADSPQMAPNSDQPCTCAPPSAATRKSKPSRITDRRTREGEAPAEPHNRIAPHNKDRWRRNGKPKRAHCRAPAVTAT